MAVIAVAGDLFAGGCNERSLMSRGEQSLSDIAAYFGSVDMVIANLEAPLAVGLRARAKLGPSLCANPDVLNGIVSVGVRAFNLANNHIMDYGLEGLENTLEACRRHNIATFGAGVNLAQAGLPFVCDLGGTSVGFFGAAEHDGQVASENSAGPFPADPVKMHRWFLEYREKIDRLVVLLHGGLEHFPFPSPRLRDLCRFLVDCGADAVICQHTHIVGCGETYQGVPIVYGQGNFMFDYPFPRSTWWEGILVELNFAAEVPASMRAHAVRSQRAVAGVKWDRSASGQGIIDGFNVRSRQLADEMQYQEIWRTYCREHRSWYLDWLDDLPRLLKKVNRRIAISSVLRSRRRCLAQHNVVACESHRDVLLEVLGDGSRRDKA